MFIKILKRMKNANNLKAQLTARFQQSSYIDKLQHERMIMAVIDSKHIHLMLTGIDQVAKERTPCIN